MSCVRGAAKAYRQVLVNELVPSEQLKPVILMIHPSR